MSVFQVNQSISLTKRHGENEKLKSQHTGAAAPLLSAPIGPKCFCLNWIKMLIFSVVQEFLE